MLSFSLSLLHEYVLSVPYQQQYKDFRIHHTKDEDNTLKGKRHRIKAFFLLLFRPRLLQKQLNGKEGILQQLFPSTFPPVKFFSYYVKRLDDF